MYIMEYNKHKGGPETKESINAILNKDQRIRDVNDVMFCREICN